MKKHYLSLSIIQILLFSTITAFVLKIVFGIIYSIYTINEAVVTNPVIVMTAFYLIFRETILPIILVLLGLFFLLSGKLMKEKRYLKHIKILSIILITLNILYAGLAIYADTVYFMYFTLAYKLYTTIALVTSLVLLVLLFLLVFEKYSLIRKILISVLIAPYFAFKVQSLYNNYLPWDVNYLPWVIILEISALIYIVCISISIGNIRSKIKEKKNEEEVK